jgi:hypothetical protein
MDMDNCLPEAVEDNTIEAIGYKPIAMPLLRSLENEHDITMREVARVATFAIKFIEQEELSSGGVGVGDQEPQIYFEPNGVDPHEITGEALSELLRGVDEEVKNVRNMIGSTSSFLRA